MVFHWSLSDSKFLRVSMTFLSILFDLSRDGLYLTSDCKVFEFLYQSIIIIIIIIISIIVVVIGGGCLINHIKIDMPFGKENNTIKRTFSTGNMKFDLSLPSVIIDFWRRSLLTGEKEVSPIETIHCISINMKRFCHLPSLNNSDAIIQSFS